MNGDKTWNEKKMRKTQKSWSKFTLGAAMGYSSGKKSSNLKTPPKKIEDGIKMIGEISIN